MLLSSMKELSTSENDLRGSRGGGGAVAAEQEPRIERIAPVEVRRLVWESVLLVLVAVQERRVAVLVVLVLHGFGLILVRTFLP
jgi:hypothetical protein